MERGFNVVDAHEPADVFVLNTCTVTERADREARQIIRRVLKNSPDAFVIVVGCYAQLQPEEIASIDGVSLVLGSKEKFSLFDYVEEFKKPLYPQLWVSDVVEAAEFLPAFAAEVGGRTRAFLKIQDGCDYTCAFCTIPLARGGSRSAEPQSVVGQASQLARQGYKEIVLTGVNIGDYGKTHGTDFFSLLQLLETIQGIERFRISSIEPNLLTSEIIQYVLQSDRFAHHFHIPLQSGSDFILKRMRRRYRAKDYREVIEQIHFFDPDAGIGADVIVGFPGETEEHFEETYSFLVDLPLSYLHVFTYSERENTPAAEFDGVVEPKVRARRSEMLRILSQKKRHAFASKFIGTIVNVLFEGSEGERVSRGMTSNYLRVRTRMNASLSNTIQPVLIDEVDDEECVGEIVKNSSSMSAVRDSFLVSSSYSEVVQ